jgi:hypothetical protein
LEEREERKELRREAYTLFLLKSLELYSFPKSTSREEVCSRLIKPTTQAYLGNVGLLTRPLTCGIFWPNTCSISRGKAQHCSRACGSDTILKSLEPYSFPKGTLREEVCSRLIKSTTHAYLGNVGLLTILGEGMVCTDVDNFKWVICMSAQAEEAKQEKEHDGKREGIEGRHFDEPICKIFSIV